MGESRRQRSPGENKEPKLPNGHFDTIRLRQPRKEGRGVRPAEKFIPSREKRDNLRVTNHQVYNQERHIQHV